MSQFMREGDDVSERAPEVGEHAALLKRDQRSAESSSDLSLTGIEIDPGLIKGSGDHLGLFPVESGEKLYQIILCVFGGIDIVVAFERSKQIVERQAVLMAQEPCLRFHILPEFRQIFFHCAEESIQSLPLHMRVFKSLSQR